MSLSQEKREMLDYLAPRVEAIWNTDISKYIKIVGVEMKPERGQGKRSNGMIKGGMSIYGVERRVFYLIKKFANDFTKKELKMVCVHDCRRVPLYIRARVYGLSHKLSFVFAMFQTLDLFTKYSKNSRKQLC